MIWFALFLFSLPALATLLACACVRAPTAPSSTPTLPTIWGTGLEGAVGVAGVDGCDAGPAACVNVGVRQGRAARIVTASIRSTETNQRAATFSLIRPAGPKAAGIRLDAGLAHASDARNPSRTPRG